jgi:dTDP-glucose 4,6-dehydratase
MRAERELKRKPQQSFEPGLAETIDWYLHHESWWQPLLERAGRY